MRTGWRGVNDRPAPRWTVLKLQKNSKRSRHPSCFAVLGQNNCAVCVLHQFPLTRLSLLFKTPQSGRSAVVVTELWADAALVGGSRGVPGVSPLWVQRGQPAFLVGLRRSEKGNKCHRGGWESQDHIWRLRVHIVTQRGTYCISVRVCIWRRLHLYGLFKMCRLMPNNQLMWMELTADIEFVAWP